jgi:uncharacterized iron-regulated membrane protein
MHVSDTPRRWPGYGAVWRWHFYAGLFCIPFILWLACTGSIYLWRPQIEALIDRPYALVAEGGARASAEAIVRAAERAVPGAAFHSYQLPETSRQAVQVLVGRGTSETRVYINPQTLVVLKTVNEDDRLMPTILDLHGQLLLGDRGSYLVELAASWAIIMIVSGLFLWWPRTSGLAGVVYPRLGVRGRALWRDLHGVIGFWVSLFALGFLVTGLPWSASWGAYLQAIRAATQTAVAAPDWTIGQADALKQQAASDSATRAAADPHAGHHDMAMMGPRVSYRPLDRLVPTVAALKLAPPVMIAPPEGAGQPWTAKSVAQDRPLRTDLTLDAATGSVVSRHDFGSRPLIDRIVGYGVSAHEGQLFGLANQLLNMVVAIGLVTLAISGAMMWWRRRPAETLGAPPAPRSSPLATGFFALLVLLAVLLPLLGVSMVAVPLVERVVLRRIPAASRWLGLRAAAA